MNTVTISEFEGLNYADVMNKVTSHVKPVIEAAQKGNEENLFECYDAMLAKLNEAKELVVNEKTYQWQFRSYNSHYDNWEICLQYINKFLTMDFQQTLHNLIQKAK